MTGLGVEFPSPVGIIHAVRDVSLRVAPGERVAILGESGSGKTMTVMSLLGLAPPEARITGRLTFKGHSVDMANRKRLTSIVRRETGIVFQDSLTSLNPTHRVGAQLCEVLLLRGRDRRASAIEAEEMLGYVGVPDPHARMQSFPHEMSGGMRQRVVIAMALLAKPSLLVADEPTTALDTTVQAQVIEVITRAQRETGMSLIMVTHDIALAADVCDRAIVMYAGYIVEDSPMSAFLKEPKHPYSRALLGAMPTLDADRAVPLQTVPGEPPSPRTSFAGCTFVDRCPLAIDTCSTTPPALEELTGGRHVRCPRHDVSGPVFTGDELAVRS